MPSIVSYRKYIDALITRELLLPEDAAHQRLGTELATVEGVTYVCLPEGAVLPVGQPAEIAASIAAVTLTDALRDAIKAASPHVRLINERVREAIAERYSVADEIKLLRTAPSAEFDAYNTYAEACRAAGRDAIAALGTVTAAETAAEAARAAQAQADAAATAAAKANNVVIYLVSHTPAECAAYVQANVTNLAQAKDMLANFAMALSVLARRSLR